MCLLFRRASSFFKQAVYFCDKCVQLSGVPLDSSSPFA